MRKFALVILDIEDKVTDKYNLDLVTEPQGLGFKLNISTLTGDIEDVITKVSQSKNVIKFTVNQYRNSYRKANSLALWIQKYSKPEYTMALEYDDGQIIRYCEGRVTSMGKTEINNFKNLPQDFEFTQTTPFFVKRENTITIQVSATGKSYPFTYPYSYGMNVVENNEIENIYIYDVPLIITIYGAINNPTIELVDESDNSYTPKQQVSFTEPLLEGERIVINSAQKRIYKISQDEPAVDYRQKVDPRWDTFLMVQNGISKVKVAEMMTTAGDGFKLIGSWREYRL